MKLIELLFLVHLVACVRAQTCTTEPEVPAVFNDLECFIPTTIVDLGSLKDHTDDITVYVPIAHAYSRYMLSYWQGRRLTSLTGADTLCPKTGQYNSSGIMEFITSAYTNGSGLVRSYKKLVDLSTSISNFNSVIDLGCTTPTANAYPVALYPAGLLNTLQQLLGLDLTGMTLVQLLENLLRLDIVEVSIMFVTCDPITQQASWHVKSTEKALDSATKTAIQTLAANLGFNSSLTVVSNYDVCDPSI